MRSIELLSSAVRSRDAASRIGRIEKLSSGIVTVSGLSDISSVGDRVSFNDCAELLGEVVAVERCHIQVLIDGPVAGLQLNQPVAFIGSTQIRPDESWIGRVVDADGNPLDDRPLISGRKSVELYANPPAAAHRRPLGNRLTTGYALFNTVLPIVRGQRIGVFSGSGVGKSSLLAAFAQDMEADVVVIALVGERGREVNHFVNFILGENGLSRSIVVAATSDQSAQKRRRAAFTAMAVAEFFRDQGLHVLIMLDSITRLAEAHREIASAAGEPLSMRGFPASMTNLLAGFAERAGPGSDGQGDITAVFTVLVSGSDMEEPVADTLRGLLDGHTVLSRAIAERGRFPAVDILQSVSRCLPLAATDEQNEIIALTRKVLSVYEESEIMVRSGLYQPGSNAELDLAISLHPAIDQFASERVAEIDSSFEKLAASLDPMTKIENG